MIWHIVRLDFTGIDPDVRSVIEARLEDLVSLDEVAWLRLARDIDDEDVTGLITCFDTEDDLVAYRSHPDHLPVVHDIRDLGIGATRADVTTDDDVADMPA